MNMATKRKKRNEPRRITLKEAIEFKHKQAESYHQYVDLNPYARVSMLIQSVQLKYVS